MEAIDAEAIAISPLGGGQDVRQDDVRIIQTRLDGVERRRIQNGASRGSENFDRVRDRRDP